MHKIKIKDIVYFHKIKQLQLIKVLIFSLIEKNYNILFSSFLKERLIIIL